MSKNCFCLVTHKWDDVTSAQWKRICDDIGDSADLWILMDVTSDVSAAEATSMLREINSGVFSAKTTNVFSFDEVFVRKKLESRGYDLQYYEQPQNLFYGNIMSAFMAFYLQCEENSRGYDYYWFKEWDVEYTGSWKTLLDKYASNDDDYISRSMVHGTTYNPLWWHAGQYKTTTLEKFAKEDLIKTFNPIMRLSRKAMEYLDKVFSEGNSGFYEIFLGTVLKKAGFKLGGFLDNGDCELRGFKFLQRGRSLEQDDLTKKDMLYHPVKKFIEISREDKDFDNIENNKNMSSRLRLDGEDLGFAWRERFSHVYCVSYAPYKERREKLIEELKRVGILNDKADDNGKPFFTFHMTVDNKFEQNLLYTSWFKHPTNNKRFNRGALSLAMGHYHVMKEALALGYERILVIEDDIAFLKDKDEIFNMLRAFPKSDIVMLDKITPQKNLWNSIVSEDNRNPEDLYVECPDDLILWTTSCFSLTRAAMEDICARQERSFNVADYYTNSFAVPDNPDSGFKFEEREITRSASIKSLACQRPSEETISDHGESNSIYKQEGQYDCGIVLEDYNL